MKATALNSSTQSILDALKNWHPFALPETFSPKERSQKEPQFTPDFSKAFRFFESKDQVQEPGGPASSTVNPISRPTATVETHASQLSPTAMPLTEDSLVACGVRAETITLLKSYGLSLAQIQALYCGKPGEYYDQALGSGKYSGYRVFVTHYPVEQKPTCTQVKNNITDNGRNDSFLRYPNIGFSFMVKYNGENYLFSQGFRNVMGVDVRSCYLVKISSQETDGSFQVLRTLVTDSATQQSVMQYAVDSGVMQKALDRVTPDLQSKLIAGETQAQAYADLTLQGGFASGFDCTYAGKMSQYHVIDTVTADGFALRLTIYANSRLGNIIKLIGADRESPEYQDYIATNFATFKAKH